MVHIAIDSNNSQNDIKALPNSSKFSNSMREMIGLLMNIGIL